MTRHTRTQQFFASPDELEAILVSLSVGGKRLFLVREAQTQPIESLAAATADAQRILIGDDPVVPIDASRQPARWGLVILDPPHLVGDELRMAVLSAVNAWTEDGNGFTDDRALRVFAQVKRILSARFVGTVDATARISGATRHYPEIRITDGALGLWKRGVRLTQGGVTGLQYSPHGTSRDE